MDVSSASAAQGAAAGAEEAPPEPGFPEGVCEDGAPEGPAPPVGAEDATGTDPDAVRTRTAPRPRARTTPNGTPTAFAPPSHEAVPSNWKRKAIRPSVLPPSAVSDAAERSSRPVNVVPEASACG